MHKSKRHLFIYLFVLIDDEKIDTKSYKISEIEVSNKLNIKNFKISKALWSPLNDFIYADCSDGTIGVFDVEKQVMN